jgi:hypothetical protein
LHYDYDNLLDIALEPFEKTLNCKQVIRPSSFGVLLPCEVFSL